MAILVVIMVANLVIINLTRYIYKHVQELIKVAHIMRITKVWKQSGDK